MNNVFWPSTPFDIWLYGFKCYGKYLSERGTLTRRIFYAFWLSQCPPQDVCKHCVGCDTGLDAIIIDCPFEVLPNENEVISNCRNCLPNRSTNPTLRK